MNQADISGKTALVTGASRGIGRQVALALADHGCHLILHSRDLAHTTELLDEVRAKGVEARTVAAELFDEAQVDAMAEEVGAIDILYNNAAIMTPWRQTWTQFPNEDFRASFEVNVIAPIRLCHAFLPGMIERKWGRIVNVTSGVKDQPEMIAYAVSKGALDKFVYDSAIYLKGTGVLMNLLDPGWLRTDLGGQHAPNAVESVLPGALVPVLLNDETCGQLFRAQDYR